MKKRRYGSRHCSYCGEIGSQYIRRDNTCICKKCTKARNNSPKEFEAAISRAEYKFVQTIC